MISTELFVYNWVVKETDHCVLKVLKGLCKASITCLVIIVPTLQETLLFWQQPQISLGPEPVKTKACRKKDLCYGYIQTGSFFAPQLFVPFLDCFVIAMLVAVLGQ